MKITSSVVTKGLSVKNAGIVILNSYIPILFERLVFINNHKFGVSESQHRAVHALEYLSIGSDHYSDSAQSLNNVLCGMALSKPASESVEFSDDEKQLMDGLLKSAIAHWPAIGQSSVDGFRGNWLVRDGLLTEYDDKWELRVAKRSFDILLNKSPFSFSMIKYPWMEKPLHVNWPY